MKVLIGVHHLPPKYTGGAEWRALRTAQGIQERGGEVRIVCVENPYDKSVPKIIFTDGELEGVPVRRYFYNHRKSPDPDHFEYDNLWLGEAIDAVIHEWHPDVFHMIGGYLLSGRAIRTAKANRIPVCLSATDFWFFCRRITMLASDNEVCELPSSPSRCIRCHGEEKRRFRLAWKIAPWLMKIYWRWNRKQQHQVEERNESLMETLKMTDLIICPSNFMRMMFIHSGISANRVEYCRQGRDFPGLTPEALEKTPADRLRIGYAGQIAWHKGVHLIGDALALLENEPVDAVIYGDDSAFPRYTHTLEQYARRDPRFKLMGKYDSANALLEVYRNLDVLVVPSLWNENSPNVIIEAFAHKTPVITTNRGGMAEMVEDAVDGLHFEHGSAESLASQIRRLLQNPALLTQLRSGIKPVKSRAQEMDELMDYYQALVSRPKG